MTLIYSYVYTDAKKRKSYQSYFLLCYQETKKKKSMQLITYDKKQGSKNSKYHFILFVTTNFYCLNLLFLIWYQYFSKENVYLSSLKISAITSFFIFKLQFLPLNLIFFLFIFYELENLNFCLCPPIFFSFCYY